MIKFKRVLIIFFCLAIIFNIAYFILSLQVPDANVNMYKEKVKNVLSTNGNFDSEKYEAKEISKNNKEILVKYDLCKNIKFNVLNNEITDYEIEFDVVVIIFNCIFVIGVNICLILIIILLYFSIVEEKEKKLNKFVCKG